MFARYVSAISSGTLITFALLYAMQGLIALQPAAESDVRSPNIVDWIHLQREEPPPPPAEPEFTKEMISKAPVPPSGTPSETDGTGFYIPIGPTTPAPVDTRLDRIRDPDGPLISIVRVQPAYPANAEARGLEGWVDVRFDVLTNGQVANIIVTASSDRLFERAAIRAAQKFRFRAPVVDGVPQLATDVDYRFRFEIND